MTRIDTRSLGGLRPTGWPAPHGHHTRRHRHPLVTFSERNGYVPQRLDVQGQAMDAPLRSDLWNTNILLTYNTHNAAVGYAPEADLPPWERSDHVSSTSVAERSVTA